MKASEIPAFVDEILETGCDIRAVGHDKYVIGDADLSPAAYEKIKHRLGDIEDVYGDRDFLKLEIVAYLRSVGRYVDLGKKRLGIGVRDRTDGGELIFSGRQRDPTNVVKATAFATATEAKSRLRVDAGDYGRVPA